ncbi:hypothetical protein MUP77_21605 [Candidatus Bathyarchaeota archaeon]|nr:hypothetical protein [Candidatus Bathyarchaeota archaeon]
MYRERWRAVLGAWDIAKIVALIVIIAGLWFLPSLIHLRQEFVTYDETIDIAWAGSSKDYVERGFVIYGSWETDVRITGSYIVQNALSARIYVMDSQNYVSWQYGIGYRAIYVSDVRTAQDFSIPIPSGNGQESIWYLVFQNPNNQGIYVINRAGVNYERAFLGHSYVEWVSRIGIVIVLFAAVWVIVSKRYEIRLASPRYHTIVHFDIPANDVVKLRRFYMDLFGWRIDAWLGLGKEYYMIETVPRNEEWLRRRPGVNGGMGKKEKDEKPLNYISVESVDEYSEKIEKLGGKITVPKQEITGIGWFAIAIDPEGNSFAIMQSI